MYSRSLLYHQAYGVLDKYKISKTFFLQTDQSDCAYLDAAPPADPPAAEAESQDPVEEAPEGENLRFGIVPDTSDIIIQTRKAQIAEKAKEAKPEEVKPAPVKLEPVIAPVIAEPLKVEPVKDEPVIADIIKEEKKPETVPEVILKTAETIKESLPAKEIEAIKEAPKVEPVVAEPEKPQEPAAKPIEAPKEEHIKVDDTKS